MELFTSGEAWTSLLVLTAMEIVLGIDNIVFITILTGRLPRDRQLAARRLGLLGALVTRLLLLLSISWVMGLTEPWFHLIRPWSGKDLILLTGGLFLVYKATREIFENVERPEEHHPEATGTAIGEVSASRAAGDTSRLMASIITQIMLLDVVFSLDSVITAVGMSEHLPVMIAAVVLSMIVMLVFAGPIGNFVQAHPSVRVLALAFLLLIGTMLIVEATGAHVSKGYIYAAMGFSLFVQVLNLRMESRLERARRRAG